MSAFDPDEFIASTPKADAFDPDAFIGETRAFRGAGASGGWGYPDPGPLGAIRIKLGQGLSKDGMDELSGALGAMGNGQGPGAYLRLPDGTEVPVPTGPDMYRAGRDFVRQEQEAVEQHWPKLGFMAQMGGEIASDAALAGKSAVGRGYQTLSGLARGLMGSNAELTPDRMTPWTAGGAALSTLFGGAVGNLAPVLMSKAGETGAAKYLGGKLDDGAMLAGDKLKDLAGWLKVNSLHPTPTTAEAMASLPGGVPAVGREVLRRGIGGMSKGSTARQASSEASRAGGAITKIVREYDGAGGAPIDLGIAIDAAKERAKRLVDEPTTRAAGERLANMIEQYEAGLGPSRMATASHALEMKRALGKAAYGAKQQLKKAGDTVAGDFGEGLSVFERSVDDVMDRSLGPQFESANLTFRRLLGASNAAKRTAARQDTNLLALGLQNLGGGTLGATLGGGQGAAAGLLGTLLLRKYGSQAGARALYGVGHGLQHVPSLLGEAALGAGRGPAAGAFSTSAAGSLADLLRPPPFYRPTDAFAMDGD